MECSHPRYLPNQELTVPCGRCSFCAATRRSDWATRLHYEARQHYGSKFVTLTYSDKFATWRNGHTQLVKSDLQKWFQRVRRSHKMRYYAVGEYGSTTYRAHYHILVFGDVPEAVLRDSWHFGMVHIGQVTQASVMYCLGYLVNGKTWQMLHKRTPPFCIMSRRPGLGSFYLQPDMIAWHKSDRKNYVLLDGKKRHLPRYYKVKIFNRLDMLKIAHKAEKENFRSMVKWIRHPLRMRMADPLAYYELQRRIAATRIKFKSKQFLTI